MILPDYRRAIHGRTWAQEWAPEAIEHHRAARSLMRPVLYFAAALVLGVAGFSYVTGVL